MSDRFKRAVNWLWRESQRDEPRQSDLGRSFYEQLAGQLPPERGLIPGLPHPGLDQIALRLLARNPADRYPHLESLRWDLSEQRWDSSEFLAGSGMVRSQLAQPGLVGRDEHLQQLLELKPGLTLLLGPPGMGKTRVLEEAARHALSRGWTVWRAECLQGSHLSWQPFQDLSAELARQPELWPEVESRLGDWLPTVLRLYPLLRPLSQGYSETWEGEFPQEHDREASLRLLRALGPCILVMDDLHWGEQGVLECLAQLEWPVLAGARQPVAQPHRCLKLEPLNRAQVELLARSMCGPVECGDLHNWSQGHPLLAAALLRNLCDSGALRLEADGWVRSELQPAWGGLSPTLEQLLRERCQALSSQAQQALAQGALLGRRFDPALLDESEPVAALQEARLGGLVYPLEEGRWDFTHDLIWQELRRSSGPSEKAAFHARVAERLLALPDPSPEAMSDHLWESNQLTACLPWTLQAARHHQLAGQLEEAAYYWRRASHLQSTEWENWFEWGSSLRQLGRYGEARKPLIRALELSRDSWQRARCRARLGESEWRAGRLAEAAEHFRQGLAELDIRVPTGLRLWPAIARELCGFPRGPAELSDRQRLAARMLDQLAYSVVYSDGIGLVWANLRGLRLTARSTGVERGILLASHAVLIMYVPALLARSRRCIHEALQLVAQHPQHLASTQARHGSILLFTGELERAIPVIRQALDGLIHSGDRYDQRMTRYNLAYCLYWLGQSEEAGQLALEGWRDACQANDWLAAAYSARVLASLGLVPRNFHEHFERANPQPMVEALRLEVLGLLQLERGRAQQASEYLLKAMTLSKRLGLSLDVAWQASWLANAYRSLAELAPLASRAALYHKGLEAAEVACRLGQAGYRQYLPQALRERGWCRLALGGKASCFAESLHWAESLQMTQQARLTRAEMARAGLEGGVACTDRFWQFRPPAASAARLAGRFDEAIHHARRVLAAQSVPEVLVAAQEAARALLGATSCRVLRGGELPQRSEVHSQLLIPLGVHWGEPLQLACYHDHLRDRFGEEESHLGTFLGAVVGAALDSTTMLEELRGRELWLDRLFEALPVGVASLDTEERILRANTALKDMLGEQLEGRALSEFEYRGPGSDSSMYLGRRGNLMFADRRVARLDSERTVVALSDVSWRRLHQVASFQEQERRLLGIEIHDVSQPLIGLSYELAARGQNECAEMARKLLSEMRSLMFDLRTPQLEDFDLAQSLRDLVHEVGSLCALECYAEISPNVTKVAGLAALFAYRIVVEGMSNVRRHSQAGRAVLRLRRVGNQLWGSLGDDGTGQSASSSRRGYGLKGIYERAQLLGGWARFRRLNSGGSVLHFRLPLEQS